MRRCINTLLSADGCQDAHIRVPAEGATGVEMSLGQYMSEVATLSCPHSHLHQNLFAQAVAIQYSTLVESVSSDAGNESSAVPVSR
jgi:hypothetical protein